MLSKIVEVTIFLLVVALIIWVFCAGFSKSDAAVEDYVLNRVIINEIAIRKLLKQEKSVTVRPEATGPGEGVTWTLFNVSGYCSKCSRCVSRRYRDGKTASGKRVKWGYMASDRRYSFGTRIEFETAIKGRKVFEVQDRGRVIKGNKLDIWFPSHWQAKKFGRQRLYGRVLN